MECNKGIKKIMLTSIAIVLCTGHEGLFLPIRCSSKSKNFKALHQRALFSELLKTLVGSGQTVILLHTYGLHSLAMLVVVSNRHILIKKEKNFVLQLVIFYQDIKSQGESVKCRR